MIFKGNDSLEVYEVNKSLVSTVSNRNQGSYICQGSYMRPVLFALVKLTR